MARRASSACSASGSEFGSHLGCQWGSSCQCESEVPRLGASTPLDHQSDVAARDWNRNDGIMMSPGRLNLRFRGKPRPPWHSGRQPLSLQVKVVALVALLSLSLWSMWMNLKYLGFPARRDLFTCPGTVHWLLPVGVGALVSPGERQGLVNLYTATRGDQWTSVTGWSNNINLSVDPCTPTPWTGITCGPGGNSIT